MPAKWQRISLDIPGDYGPDERDAIAQEIVDFIVERAQSGKGKGGKAFAPYSESYAKSLDFKVAGKSKGNVNLTLSGDMLADIKTLSTAKGKIVYGFENGSESNAKADGNIRGTYGNTKSVGPKRDFLGITQQELDKILSKYSRTDREASVAQAARVKAASEFAGELAEGVVGDG